MQTRRGPYGDGETFIASSAEPIPRGTPVVIYDIHGGRRVDVEPLTTTGG
jgi:hypothetical protein